MFSIVSKSAVGSLWGRRKKITSRAWKRLAPTLVFERLISVKSFKTPNPNVYKFETYPQMVILPEAYGKSLVCIAVGYGTARKSKTARRLVSLLLPRWFFRFRRSRTSR